MSSEIMRAVRVTLAEDVSPCHETLRDSLVTKSSLETSHCETDLTEGGCQTLRDNLDLTILCLQITH